MNLTADAALPTAVNGDAPRFGQMVGHLLANAVKFTAQGSIEVVVRAAEACAGLGDLTPRDEIVRLVIAVLDGDDLGEVLHQQAEGAADVDDLDGHVELIEDQDAGVEGMQRFLSRVYRLVTRYGVDAEPGDAASSNGSGANPAAEQAVVRKLHQTIQKVTEDFDSRWHFNTSLAALMELTNELYAKESEVSPEVMRDTLVKMVPLLGPFAPYLTAELWQELGQASAVEKSSWPDFDADLAREYDVEVVLQVNGKLRSKLNVPRGTSREELERMAKEDPKVIAHLDGKAIRKAIVVPDKLVNVVVG